MVHVCETCGAQFEQRPEVCPICDDPRQWVPEDGQRWTTREALAEDRDQVVRQDGAFEGVGVEPAFAIGQRAQIKGAQLGRQRDLLVFGARLHDADRLGQQFVERKR